MKHLKISIILLFFTLLTTNTIGQTSVQKVYNSGFLVTKAIEEKGLEVVHLEYNMLSDTLASKSLQRYLTTGYEYIIMAFGGDEIKDLDIKIYKDIPEKWKYITEDDSEDNFATAKVIPDSTKKYLIKIFANEFEQGKSAGYYGLVIAHSIAKSKTEQKSGHKKIAKPDISNLNISTNKSQYANYIDKKINVISSENSATLFKINAEVTQIKHSTETASSTYFINSKSYDEELGTWKLNVVSDVGNNYTYLLNLSDKKITTVIKEDGKTNLLIFHIKSTWKAK